MKVYSDRLLAELNGENGGNTRFFKRLADGTTIRRPNALKTIIAQVDKKYFNRIKEQGSFIDPTARVEARESTVTLSQADADDIATSMYAAIARPIFMGVDFSAVEAVAPIYDAIEESEKPSSIEEVLESVAANIDANPQTRKAFERAATTFGISNAESLPTATLVDVLRNEMSGDVAKAVNRAIYILRGGTEIETAQLSNLKQSSEEGDVVLAKSIALSNKIEENRAVAALREKERQAGALIDSAQKDILGILSSELPYGARVVEDVAAPASAKQNARLEALFARNPLARLVRELES